MSEIHFPDAQILLCLLNISSKLTWLRPRLERPDTLIIEYLVNFF
jgi:hypothetical protein